MRWMRRCDVQSKYPEGKNVGLLRDNKLSRTAARFGRKLRGGILCLKEHGFWYTFFHTLHKILILLGGSFGIPLYFLCVMFPAYHRYAVLKKRTDNAHIFSQYYPGTGDAMFSAAYIKYLYNNGLEKDKLSHSVFVVNGKNARGVAELFCPSEIPIIVQSDLASRSLVHLMRFMGESLEGTTILHYMDLTMYTSLFFDMVGVNGLNFADLYRAAFFGNAPLPEPMWEDNTAWVVGTFQTYQLQPHKTVLLAPYANSLFDTPGIVLWQQLAEKLRARGFTVCTNVASRKEKPIPGTVGVFIPYCYLKIFCEYGGYFLAFRNGLCDLAAFTKCKKIVLYPATQWPDSQKSIASSMEVFSLNEMELCQDTVEIVVNRENFKEVTSQILQIL